MNSPCMVIVSAAVKCMESVQSICYRAILNLASDAF